ncbi:hypothetical protein EDC01DRAFT_635198 [Geopyxis carbonaria]|nr:hypothetical protein EDC01DRAFT_635198 [Geopyxis carbonaria]
MQNSTSRPIRKIVQMNVDIDNTDVDVAVPLTKTMGNTVLGDIDNLNIEDADAQNFKVDRQDDYSDDEYHLPDLRIGTMVEQENRSSPVPIKLVAPVGVINLWPKRPPPVKRTESEEEVEKEAIAAAKVKDLVACRPELETPCEWIDYTEPDVWRQQQGCHSGYTQAYWRQIMDHPVRAEDDSDDEDDEVEEGEGGAEGVMNIVKIVGNRHCEKLTVRWGEGGLAAVGKKEVVIDVPPVLKDKAAEAAEAVAIACAPIEPPEVSAVSTNVTKAFGGLWEYDISHLVRNDVTWVAKVDVKNDGKVALLPINNSGEEVEAIMLRIPQDLPIEIPNAHPSIVEVLKRRHQIAVNMQDSFELCETRPNVLCDGSIPWPGYYDQKLLITMQRLHPATTRNTPQFYKFTCKMIGFYIFGPSSPEIIGDVVRNRLMYHLDVWNEVDEILCSGPASQETMEVVKNLYPCYPLLYRWCAVWKAPRLYAHIHGPVPVLTHRARPSLPILDTRSQMLRTAMVGSRCESCFLAPGELPPWTASFDKKMYKPVCTPCGTFVCEICTHEKPPSQSTRVPRICVSCFHELKMCVCCGKAVSFRELRNCLEWCIACQPLYTHQPTTRKRTILQAKQAHHYPALVRRYDGAGALPEIRYTRKEVWAGKTVKKDAQDLGLVDHKEVFTSDEEAYSEWRATVQSRWDAVRLLERRDWEIRTGRRNADPKPADAKPPRRLPPNELQRVSRKRFWKDMDERIRTAEFEFTRTSAKRSAAAKKAERREDKAERQAAKEAERQLAIESSRNPETPTKLKVPTGSIVGLRRSQRTKVQAGNVDAVSSLGDDSAVLGRGRGCGRGRGRGRGSGAGRRRALRDVFTDSESDTNAKKATKSDTESDTDSGSEYSNQGLEAEPSSLNHAADPDPTVPMEIAIESPELNVDPSSSPPYNPKAREDLILPVAYVDFPPAEYVERSSSPYNPRARESSPEPAVKVPKSVTRKAAKSKAVTPKVAKPKVVKPKAVKAKSAKKRRAPASVDVDEKVDLSGEDALLQEVVESDERCILPSLPAVPPVQQPGASLSPAVDHGGFSSQGAVNRRLRQRSARHIRASPTAALAPVTSRKERNARPLKRPTRSVSSKAKSTTPAPPPMIPTTTTEATEEMATETTPTVPADQTMSVPTAAPVVTEAVFSPAPPTASSVLNPKFARWNKYARPRPSPQAPLNGESSKAGEKAWIRRMAETRRILERESDPNSDDDFVPLHPGPRGDWSPPWVSNERIYPEKYVPKGMVPKGIIGMKRINRLYPPEGAVVTGHVVSSGPPDDELSDSSQLESDSHSPVEDEDYIPRTRNKGKQRAVSDDDDEEYTPSETTQEESTQSSETPKARKSVVASSQLSSGSSNSSVDFMGSRSLLESLPSIPEAPKDANAMNSSSPYNPRARSSSPCRPSTPVRGSTRSRVRARSSPPDMTPGSTAKKRKIARSNESESSEPVRGPGRTRPRAHSSPPSSTPVSKGKKQKLEHPNQPSEPFRAAPVRSSTRTSGRTRSSAGPSTSAATGRRNFERDNQASEDDRSPVRTRARGRARSSATVTGTSTSGTKGKKRKIGHRNSSSEFEESSDN